MSDPRSLRLVRAAHPDRPVLDTAVSKALLLRAARGEVPQTFRLHRGRSVLAFGKRDTSSPGYAAAVVAARARGFEAVERLVGGRAAVFHGGTLAFSHVDPDPDPTVGIKERFERTAGLMAAALRRLGVDARVGEVAGEYCPGGSSVNARGVTKIVGVGQRVVAGASHTGGVVVVSGSDRIREVLLPVYEALEIDWDPATVGSVEDEIGPTTTDDVADAIVAELAEHYDLVEGRLDDATLALAEELHDRHLSPPFGEAAAS